MLKKRFEFKFVFELVNLSVKCDLSLRSVNIARGYRVCSPGVRSPNSVRGA